MVGSSSLSAHPAARRAAPPRAHVQFENFYEEVFEELAKFGHLEEMHVLDNHSDHMVGNVYAKFKREEDSAQALTALNGRFYAGRQLVAEFCPVTDFREARCRQFDEGTCARGYLCNFMHIKEVPRSLLRSVVKNQPHTGDSCVARRGAGAARPRLPSPRSPVPAVAPSDDDSSSDGSRRRSRSRSSSRSSSSSRSKSRSRSGSRRRRDKPRSRSKSGGRGRDRSADRAASDAKPRSRSRDRRERSKSGEPRKRSRSPERAE